MNLLATAIAAVAVMASGAVIGGVWTVLGISQIGAPGWLAMDLGVIVTLALGVGLIALFFISNRSAPHLALARVREREGWGSGKNR
ncbi:MAG: hypothetical protein JO081_08360 [Alphaproteobacteria bacterium]|nr:hypothetical protein [Alphaproteobacteria bacterium]